MYDLLKVTAYTSTEVKIASFGMVLSIIGIFLGSFVVLGNYKKAVITRGFIALFISIVAFGVSFVYFITPTAQHT